MSTSFAPSALDEQAIVATDTTGQLNDVLALASHLRDALARVDAADPPASRAYSELVVAGMGGSAAGARLAVAALGSVLVGWLVSWPPRERPVEPSPAIEPGE